MLHHVHLSKPNPTKLVRKEMVRNKADMISSSAEENKELGHPRQTRGNRSRPSRAHHQELLTAAASIIHRAYCLLTVNIHGLHLRPALPVFDSVSDRFPGDPSFQPGCRRPAVFWNGVRNASCGRLHCLHPERLQQKARRQRWSHDPGMAFTAGDHGWDQLLLGPLLVWLVRIQRGYSLDCAYSFRPSHWIRAAFDFPAELELSCGRLSHVVSVLHLQPLPQLGTKRVSRSAASAIAANTFLRSIFGAVFPLFATYMFNSLGVNWAGTLLGCVALILVPIPVIFWKYGARIRQKSKFAPTAKAMPMLASEKDGVA